MVLLISEAGVDDEVETYRSHQFTSAAISVSYRSQQLVDFLVLAPRCLAEQLDQRVGLSPSPLVELSPVPLLVDDQRAPAAAIAEIVSALLIAGVLRRGAPTPPPGFKATWQAGRDLVELAGRNRSQPVDSRRPA